MELALGYEGGVGAFLTFAAAYGIDLEAMAETADIPPDIEEEARGMLEWHRIQRHDIPPIGDETWIVCESFKRMWRYAHPNIAKFWGELRDAVVVVLSTQHCRLSTFVGLLAVDKQGAWLRIRLPSGRYLCYPSAMLDDENKISYMGVNQYSRKWSRLYTYGGKLFENVCQAVARDIMAHNMPTIEAAGYQIVLTVHDEVICEAPDSPEFNAEHLSSLLATNPPWALNIPLAASGFESYRYKKE